MKTRTKTISYLLALGGLGLWLAHAQEVGSGAPGLSAPPEADFTLPAEDSKTVRVNPVATGDQVKEGDRDFLTKSLRTGEDLVDLADIASDRAVHPQVRAFADELSGAHTTMNQELAAIVLRKGLRIADRDTTAARETKKKWNEKTGNEFDGDYLKATIDLHEELIDLLEDGEDSNEADIAAYARRHLPSMKSHVTRAKSLLEAID